MASRAFCGVAIQEKAVYIMTNKRNGTLYVGVTSNLIQSVVVIWPNKPRSMAVTY